jgi:ADP-ribose pyrophosphatase YjhB (NUDIX family)
VARTDHFYDPEAPKANRIVVAVTVFVLNDHDEVLLIQRTDNGLWALPGGGQEIGENIAQTAVRETLEETGVRTDVVGLVGIYSDPDHVVAYDDGEVRQQFSICLRARYVDGAIGASDESANVGWISRSTLDQLAIHPSMRLRIDHGYGQRREPYIG